MTVIPDPEKPQRWAVNAKTGELLTGMQIVPALLNVPAPTLAELEAGTTLWFKDGSITFGPRTPTEGDGLGKFQIPQEES